MMVVAPLPTLLGALLILQGALDATAARPANAVDGDVVIALNAACSEDGWISCAPFHAALLAWQDRKVLEDKTDGAAGHSAPPAFTVGWDLKNNDGNPGIGVSNAVENWMERRPAVNAQIGMSWSSVTMASAQLAHHTKHLMMGYSATNAKLSNKKEYAYFMRTCPPDSLQSAALLAVVDKFQAKKLMFLFIDEPYAAGIYNYFRDNSPLTSELYSEALLNQPSAFDEGVWAPAMARMIAREERYILTAAAAGPAFLLWQTARNVGLLTPDRQFLGAEGMVANSRLNLNDIVGAIGVRPMNKAPLWTAWMEYYKSLSADQFPEFYGTPDMPAERLPINQERISAGFNTFYDPFLVDGLFAILFAAERLVKAGTPVQDVRGELLKTELYKSAFPGVSGFVAFDANGDRSAAFEVWNVVKPAGDVASVAVAGLWTGAGLVIGGWEGNDESPLHAKLIFTGGSPTPLRQQLQGCGEGLRYINISVGCLPCLPGTSSNLDSNTQSECRPCEPGFFSPTEGAKYCSPCRSGTAQNATGQVDCNVCPSGEFSGAVASSTCETCSEGTFSAGGAKACTNCPSGQYAPSTRSANCEQCPQGFTTEFVGSTTAAACACPLFTLFVPGAGSRDPSLPTGAPHGTCFKCNDPADGDVFADGLVCAGGLACEGLANRTVQNSFPCPGNVFCVDPDGCSERCMVQIQHARELCEDYDFAEKCDGWTVRSDALRHGDMLDSQLGWQNVAILGTAFNGEDASPGIPSKGWVLYPKREFCAPLPVTNPSYWATNSSKAFLKSVPQPPLAKKGYYLANLQAVLRALVPTDYNGNATFVEQEEALLTTRLQTTWADEKFVILPIGGGPNSSIVPLFKCAACSGGQLGQCYPGQTGLNCANCVPGFFTSSSVGCARCSDGGLATFIPILFFVLALGGFVVLYRTTLHPLASQLSAKLTTCLALGLTFNGLQSFGVLSLMSMEFDEPLKSILSSFRLFLFDMDQLQWECLMSVTPMGKLTVRIIFPLLICGMWAALFAVTQVLNMLKPGCVVPFTVPHTLNCCGMVLQVLFISICMGVIMPFKCAAHPVGGVSTLVDIPYQVCGVGEHTAMSVLGAVCVLLYPVMGIAMCTWAIWILPGRTARDPRFLQYFKFLVSRFRFDRYYFGIFFMFRNLLIAVVPVLNPNDPMLQAVAMTGILLVALVSQALLWPWAAREVNYLDTTTMFAMVMTVVLSTGVIDHKSIDRQGVTTASVVCVGSTFVVMLLIIGHAALRLLSDICAKRRSCRCLTERFSKRLAEAQVAETSESLRTVVHVLKDWKPRGVEAFVDSLPDYDHKTLRKAVAMLVGAIEDERQAASLQQSTTRSFRITVNRFKPRASLQMTPEEVQQSIVMGGGGGEFIVRSPSEFSEPIAYV